MPRSLFSKVTKYSASPLSRPWENRLTEVTAAVLTEVDGLAFQFIQELLKKSIREDGPETEEDKARDDLLEALARLRNCRATIRTQVRTRSGRFVDLEVIFRSRSSNALKFVAWVEIKHGTKPHSGQLRAYLNDIGSVALGARKAVLLLAPRDDLPFEFDVPEEVPSISWQSLAGCLSGYEPSTETTKQKWLLRQYSEFLKEEDLMDPDRLTAAHALSIMESTNAENAMKAICGQADNYVLNEWNHRGNNLAGTKEKPRHGLGFWSQFPTHNKSSMGSGDWHNGWFEFGLWRTSDARSLNDPRGAWFIAAGASWKDKNGNATTFDGNESWVRDRLGQGFVQFNAGACERLMKIMYPDQLLAADTLDRQGRELGEWIVSAFRELSIDPPPN